MENKNCPFCKENNNCKVKEKCWCFNIEIPKVLLLKTSLNNKTCICKNCILEYEKDKHKFLVKYNLL